MPQTRPEESGEMCGPNREIVSLWASTAIWWIISEKRVMRIIRVYDHRHHDSDNRSCKLFHLGPLTHPFLLNAWNIPNGIYLSRLEIHFAFSARLTFNSLPFHRLMHASSLSAVYWTHFSLEAKIWTNTISSSLKQFVSHSETAQRC